MRQYLPTPPMIVASLGALVVFFCCLTLGAKAITPQHHASMPDRICFSSRTWDGTVPDRYRPCVRITRLYEDGSFRFSVSDADGTVRYTSGVGALDR